MLNQYPSFTHKINTQSAAHIHAYAHQIWSDSKQPIQSNPIIKYSASNTTLIAETRKITPNGTQVDNGFTVVSERREWKRVGDSKQKFNLSYLRTLSLSLIILTIPLLSHLTLSFSLSLPPLSHLINSLFSLSLPPLSHSLSLSCII